MYNKIKTLFFILIPFFAQAQYNGNFNKVRILATPTRNDTLSQIIVRDPANNGELNYRSAESLKVSLGTSGQIPFINTGGTDFSYSSIKWLNSLNSFNGGLGSASVTGQYSFNFGLNSSIASNWSASFCEDCIINSSANNTFSTGWSNTVGGSGSDGSGGLSWGADNLNNGTNMMVGGLGAAAVNSTQRSGGLSIALQGPSVDGLKPSNIPYVTASTGSFNISKNTSFQTDGYGALGEASGVLGGVDHHIPSTVPNSVILGGRGIVAIDSNTVYMNSIYVKGDSTYNAFFNKINQFAIDSAGDIRMHATTVTLDAGSISVSSDNAITHSINDGSIYYSMLPGTFSIFNVNGSIAGQYSMIGGNQTLDYGNGTTAQARMSLTSTGFNVLTGTTSNVTRFSIRPAGTIQLNLGSDATGDMMYRNSSGNLTRIAAGTTGQVLTQGASSIPSWTTMHYKGSFSQVGSATTTFTVSIGATLANSTYNVQITPTASLSATDYYVTSKTTTQFNVVYLSGLTGTVTFDWLITP